MKNLVPLNLFLVLLLFGCYNSSQKSATNFNTQIPTLLDRPEKLYYGKEWEAIQNLYAGALNQMRKNDNPQAYLRLCEVFINEARVTGEHGHYYPSALNVFGYIGKAGRSE